MEPDQSQASAIPEARVPEEGSNGVRRAIDAGLQPERATSAALEDDGFRIGRDRMGDEIGV